MIPAAARGAQPAPENPGFGAAQRAPARF